MTNDLTDQCRKVLLKHAGLQCERHSQESYCDFHGGDACLVMMVNVDDAAACMAEREAELVEFVRDIANGEYASATAARVAWELMQKLDATQEAP